MTEHIIIHGNCKYPFAIPDESVQLVVTSPPYFDVINYADQTTGNIGNRKDDELPYEGYLQEMVKVYEQCFRVLKWGGFIVSNIADVISNTEKYPLSYDHFILLRQIFGHNGYQDTIMWQKPSGMSTQKRFGVFIQNPYPYYFRPNNMYEPCIVFVKGKREYTERCRQHPLRWESMKKYQTDIWQMQPETQVTAKGLHEAPFPMELPSTFIKFFTCPDDYVYDPFMGSGTTMKASLELGRNCWGCELEDKHIETIRLRTGFQNGMMQGEWTVNLGQDKFKVIKGQVIGTPDIPASDSDDTLHITPVTTSSDSEPLVLCDEQLSVLNVTPVEIIGNIVKAYNLSEEEIKEGKPVVFNTFTPVVKKLIEESTPEKMLFPTPKLPLTDWKDSFGDKQEEPAFVDPFEKEDDGLVIAPFEDEKTIYKREQYERTDSFDWDCTDCGESFTTCSDNITSKNGVIPFHKKCKYCQSTKIKKVFP